MLFSSGCFAFFLFMRFTKTDCLKPYFLLTLTICLDISTKTIAPTSAAPMLTSSNICASKNRCCSVIVVARKLKSVLVKSHHAARLACEKRLRNFPAVRCFTKYSA